MADPAFARNVVHVGTVPSREAEYVPMPRDLPPALSSALEARGIGRLYSHQAECYRLGSERRPFVVVTPTASGKTLCYNLPVMTKLLEDPEARALYLFPTKALSQDQQSELNGITLSGSLGVRIATYDGDTPQSVRASARDSGRIVISNPDMLHSGILPNHAKWVRFFSGLAYVVIDELHSYRGIFGSHVANVVRRLKRIAAFYGADPTFIACSATIGNPGELFEGITGVKGAVVDRNGAPRSEKKVVFYNPPVVDPVQGIRRSTANETRDIAVRLLKAGVRTILFARSRLRVELIASYINERLRNVYTGNAGIVVEPYRSGLLPNERRAIEKGLREGTVHGVVSTNALELGIDIGGLDAAVIAGFPGSFASFWQQTGRAGRRQGLSLGIFVASSAPLDQYVIGHPEYFMEGNPERARIDPDNPYVYSDHVKCACFELPFADGEAFGPEVEAALEYLEEDGIVRHTRGAWYWSSDGYPSEGISLRSATADNVVIIDTTGGRNEVIGEMDRPGAKELIYDDAVYIHRGKQYLVLKLDIENRECRVVAKDTNYYTDAVTKTDIRILTEDRSVSMGAFATVFGDVLVRTQAEKYKKLKFETHENIGFGEVYQEAEEMQTRYLALLFPENAELERRDEATRAALLSGTGRVLREMASMFLMCDVHDLGLAVRSRDEHFGKPSILLYDRYPGGTGLSEALAESMEKVWASSLERVDACPCSHGCPSCIGVDFGEGLPSGADAGVYDGSGIKRAALGFMRSLQSGKVSDA